MIIRMVDRYYNYTSWVDNVNCWFIIERNTNDFTNLAKQGVLLLNSSLTVNEGLPGSHSNIWKDLTNDIIKYISTNCNKLVFILWGNHAKKKIK